ncbi:MAG TPA: hypothetical protein VGI39_45500, partial [Polyangiaceae bacterium]
MKSAAPPSSSPPAGLRRKPSSRPMWRRTLPPLISTVPPPHDRFHDRAVDRQREMERRRLERLAAMGTMVAGFAHEVRNPMASLRSIAESLSEELAEAHV